MTPEEQYRFDQFRYGLHVATPKAMVARTLVVMNVLVYGLMIMAGYDPMATEGVTPTLMLIEWGANFGPYTTDGDWWRLLTCCFLHGPIYHIAINMWVLWSEGPLVEKMVGNAGFTALYIISGLIGSIASVLIRPDVLSVGASGAIFGVIGAMGAVLMKHRHSLPAKVRISLMRSGGLFVGLNVLLALQMDQIDWAAHVGGFVAGGLCGLGLAHPFTPEGVNGRPLRNLRVALIGLLVTGASITFVPNRLATLVDATEMVTAMRFKVVYDKYLDDQTDTESMRKLVVEDIIPTYERLEARIPKDERTLILVVQGQRDRWKAVLAELNGRPQIKRQSPQPVDQVDPRTEDPRGD